MSPNLLKLVDKYKKMKDSSFQEIESYSLLLHEEFSEEFVDELPGFSKNYSKITSVAASIAKNELTFDFDKDQIRIFKGKKELLSKRIYKIDQISAFLEDEDLTQDQRDLVQLFLSNTESIILSNLAMHSIDLGQI